MNKRRTFLTSTGASISLTALSARGQSPKRLPVVGVLISYPPDKPPALQRHFIAGLRELGWEERRNIVIELRYTDGTYTKLPELAAELVQLAPDLILAGTNATADPVRKLTSSIPIVMASAIDPIGTGLIASFRRPGGNVTGIAWDQSPGVTGKYVEFLREFVPQLHRLGCLIDPVQKGIALYRDHLEAACKQLGVTVAHREVSSPADIGPAIQTLAEQNAQALFCYGSSVIHNQLQQITALAQKFRLPDMYIFKEALGYGGLMSYGPNQGAMYHRAAYYADKILKGAKPGELPMEQPTIYELMISRKAATRLGLRIPPALLARADEVID